MSNASYDAVSAAMTARENARKAAPLNPFGSQDRWRCLGCGAWPLGGVPAEMSADDAIVLGTKLGSAVAVYDSNGNREGVCCGPSCVRRLNVERQHNDQPQVTAERPKLAPPEPQRLLPIGTGGAQYVLRQDRVSTVSCLGGCGVAVTFDQSRAEDDPWQPSASHVATLHGFLPENDPKYCKGCFSKVNKPPVAGAPRTVEAVSDLRQVDPRGTSYPSVRSSNPLAREIPDGMAKTGKPAKGRH